MQHPGHRTAWFSRTLFRSELHGALLGLAAVMLLSSLAKPTTASAEALPISLDGLFGDWTGASEMTDPSGDAGGSGIDFLEFDFANDDDWMFLRPTQSEFVFLQFGDIAVLDGQEIVDHWPVFSGTNA